LGKEDGPVIRELARSYMETNKPVWDGALGNSTVPKLVNLGVLSRVSRRRRNPEVHYELTPLGEKKFENLRSGN
jgi:hypothetical protein